MDNVAEKLGILMNAISLKPTSVTNSGNDYTIVIDPTLNADVVEGMSFYIKPNANNTNAVRLRVTTGNPYYDVTRADGTALETGEWNTSTYYFVAFLGGAFRILSEVSQAQVTSVAIFQQFDNSGTWTKPAGLSADAIVIVEAWSGGGGGGRGASVSFGGGGGGGCYVRKEFKAGDLTSSVSVTIGNGGSGTATNNTSGGAGGNTSFGGYLTAYGGGGGGAGGGGGGGGAGSAGTTGGNLTASAPGGGPTLLRANAVATGSRAQNFGGDYHSDGSIGISNGSTFGGGAGAGNSTSSAAGSSVFGGGGGASDTQAAGTSVAGGNGGAFSLVGTAPGGGGGGGGAGGGKGRVIVRVVP